MDWWGLLMKKKVIYVVLVLCLTFVLSGCNADKQQETSDVFTIEEDMIYENEAQEKDSGKPYDKDSDGFVDGWY